MTCHCPNLLFSSSVFVFAHVIPLPGIPPYPLSPANSYMPHEVQLKHKIQLMPILSSLLIHFSSVFLQCLLHNHNWITIIRTCLFLP
jgi:hypothetical protein